MKLRLIEKWVKNSNLWEILRLQKQNLPGPGLQVLKSENFKFFFLRFQGKIVKMMTKLY